MNNNDKQARPNPHLQQCGARANQGPEIWIILFHFTLVSLPPSLPPLRRGIVPSILFRGKEEGKRASERARERARERTGGRTDGRTCIRLTL